MAGLVILTGFMGTGKTAVGKRLAARLGRRFVDTDAMIEAREQRSVAQIFAAEGEAYFRAREREVVAEVAGMRDAVVATGGGTIVDDENFRILAAAGTLICLTADASTILARTGGRGRPLLAGEDRAELVRRLLASRAPTYGRVEHTIDTSGKSVEQVVLRIRDLLRDDAPPGEP